jgi:hypothetical protein
MGCRVSCRRSNIEQHLKECRFAPEVLPADVERAEMAKAMMNHDDYEVCPSTLSDAHILLLHLDFWTVYETCSNYDYHELTSLCLVVKLFMKFAVHLAL